MKAAIKAIEFYLPEVVLDNNQLAAEFPEWPAEKIEQKTGIAERHIARSGECSSDLAFRAANKLFDSGVCQPDEIDYLLYCTQSPDYYLPTTACVLQHRLGLPMKAGALDFNLGCSGFVYGLGLAKGLIETGQAQNVLLITAETYSKFMHPLDKSVRTLFGDAAAATLIQGIAQNYRGNEDLIGPFVYGTDGGGANNLIVQTGGLRNTVGSLQADRDENDNPRIPDNLYMNGPEIFNFTLQTVPRTVASLLTCSGRSLNEIDLFVFHQANQFMLEHLRKKMNIAPEKFVIALRQYGNTVSSTIPIALKDALSNGKLRSGYLVMLVGFGVGYSWGATLVRWIG